MRSIKKLFLIAVAVCSVPAHTLLAQNSCSFLHNLACVTPESICWPAAIGSHEAYGQCLRKFDNGYCLPCAGFNDPKDCSSDNSDCKNFSGSVPSLWPSDPAGSFGNSTAAQAFSGTASLQSTPGLSTGFATAGSLVVEAAVDAQKRIFYTWWIKGGAGKGWKEFDGNGRAVSAPAIALSQITLFALIKESDGYLYLNQGGLAQAFTGWQRMPFQSKYAPAMSTSMNNVVVVAADQQGRPFYSYWTRGGSGTSFIEIPGGILTDAAPAAALVSDYLFVVVKSLDGNVYLNQGQLGKPFVGWQQMGIKTAVSPSADSSNGNTVVVVKDIYDTIQYSWWTIGQGGHWQSTGDSLPVALTTALQAKAGPPQTVGPSVALTVDNYLFISLPAATGKLFLDQGDLGKPFVGWRPQ